MQRPPNGRGGGWPSERFPCLLRGSRGAASPLEAELAAARKKIRELEEERDTLRRAAKYFAGDCVLNTKGS